MRNLNPDHFPLRQNTRPTLLAVDADGIRKMKNKINPSVPSI
ncbi:MAG: hypothetical protein P8164_10655 [Gammaproteobacteria bacterium]